MMSLSTFTAMTGLPNQNSFANRSTNRSMCLGLEWIVLPILFYALVPLLGGFLRNKTKGTVLFHVKSITTFAGSLIAAGLRFVITTESINCNN